jgi:hypothetical protein
MPNEREQKASASSHGERASDGHKGYQPTGQRGYQPNSTKPLDPMKLPAPTGGTAVQAPEGQAAPASEVQPGKPGQ